MVSGLGCGASLACARAAPLASLIAVEAALLASLPATPGAIGPPFQVVQDPASFPTLLSTLAAAEMTPYAALLYPQISKVNLLLGTNNDEGVLFQNAIQPVPTTAAGLATYLGTALGSAAAGAATTALYNGTLGYDATTTLEDVITDFVFRCSSMLVGSLIAGAGNNVYAYRFNATIAAGAAAYPLLGIPQCANKVRAPHDDPIVLSSVVRSRSLKACHTQEIPFVFGNPLASVLSLNAANGEAALSASIQKAWVNFATTGNPNTGTPTGLVAWPQLTNSTRIELVFQNGGPGASTTETTLGTTCSFWDSILKQQALAAFSG